MRHLNPLPVPPVHPPRSQPPPVHPVQISHGSIPQYQPHQSGLAPVSPVDAQLSSLKGLIKEVHLTLKGINELRDGNYVYWREQVYSAFEVRDLEDFLNGARVWPDPRDLTATKHGYVNGQAMAAQKWRVLQEVHAPLNMAHALQVRQALERTVLREDGSMSKHLNTLCDLVGQLRHLGQDVSEEAQKLIYLCSLPASYSHICNTYLISPASLNDIVKGLCSVAQTRALEQPDEGTSGTHAFAAQSATMLQLATSRNISALSPSPPRLHSARLSRTPPASALPHPAPARLSLFLSLLFLFSPFSRTLVV
ncbi:hypothetical protein FRC07_013638 [Ceratobasidium sp. 392]|nr:hypothetical protein FRC07_013638 [Ceratobasidium sp. 392]